jgi:hypothetical protein
MKVNALKKHTTDYRRHLINHWTIQKLPVPKENKTENASENIHDLRPLKIFPY